MFSPRTRSCAESAHAPLRQKMPLQKEARPQRSAENAKWGYFGNNPPTCFRKNRTSKRLHRHWNCHIQTETKRKRAVANRFTFATASFLFPDAGKYGHTALLFFSVYVLSSCILYAILQALLYASAKYCSYGIAA